jgi:hypothetical protein
LEWFELIKNNIESRANFEIKLCLNMASFSMQISAFKAQCFDVIVIDSRDRAKCMEVAPIFLKPNGIIILDNSERENLKNSRAVSKSEFWGIIVFGLGELGNKSSGFCDCCTF